MGNVVKRLAVFGSTGSIGRQTLEVVRAFPDRFRIIALAAAQNLVLFTEQIQEFKPRFVYLQSEETVPSSAECEFLTLEGIAGHPDVDIVVMATSGSAGLLPLLTAVRCGKKIALASKEPLVMAGETIIKEARLNGAQLLPVDSEHSAVWQCLRGEDQKPLRLTLTASGGPFLNHSPERLGRVTVKQALEHPSWRMGPKITIDSATLMNKGLEVIEAHWLFDIPFANISVLVHPQSIVHVLVEFSDGSVKAQLGYPDMRLPIQYALTYPDRLSNPELPRLSWDKMSKLDFLPPDDERFPCLRLAIEAGKRGGTCPTVLCAADEIAVELFLSQRIKFTDIAFLIEQVLAQHQGIEHPTIEEIITAADWARDKTRHLVRGAGSC
jgi:1-deoxy-D-xylulose-5-phosphate reductoisomerase